jgi:predicted transcriptional regulator
MKKIRVTLTVGTSEEFFQRLKERAKMLDRGEMPASGITISFEDPQEMLRVLSSERARLLRRIKGESMPIAALACDLKRDVRAVSRDVNLLEEVGLLRTSYRSNPGHGRIKIVEPVAQEFVLQASL